MVYPEESFSVLDSNIKATGGQQDEHYPLLCSLG